MNEQMIEELKELIKECIGEAFLDLQKKDKMEKKKGAFRNTKLLMENYNAFKFNAEKGISDSNQLNIDLYEEIDEDTLYVMSIRRSKLRSLIMVSHIDACLKNLKDNQTKKGTIEKFNIFTYYFIEGMTYERMAEEYSCATITARRWIKEMLMELGFYLFGVDGLKII